ncbi:MAG: molybdopterin-dependent oxidoreductase, partial [Candidatus Electryoneaceae bacterium]|nr:molybdopterin-dependent oxidoreductase [Candidatus Electryoneaceae bacterium]
LKNHPLDCPVCDYAGECKLQDYYFDYGKFDSRLHDQKHPKHKAVDVGPSIVLDSERCVLCSRCVRFLSEITHTHELGIFGMGSHEEVNIHPGGYLDNDYAGNVVDLCPVGALTNKDFRFKRRVWYIQSASSICQLCSRGCNVRIDYDLNPFHQHKRSFQENRYRTEATEHQRIQRIKPRKNISANGFYICDHGRYGYRITDSADRLLHPMVLDDGELKQVTLLEAVKEMVAGISLAVKKGQQKIAVIVSPKLTNEELFAVWVLFRDRLETANMDHRLPIDPQWYGDDLLRTPDPFPNRTGCEWIGIEPSEKGIGISGLSEAILKGKIDTLISILADPREFLSSAALNKLKQRYLIVRNLPEELIPLTDIALPAAAWGEYSGTFTNFRGRVQRLEAAFDPIGEALPVWKLMVALSAPLKKSLKWRSSDDVLDALGRKMMFFRGLTWDKIGSEGVDAPLEESQKKNSKAVG